MSRSGLYSHTKHKVCNKNQVDNTLQEKLEKLEKEMEQLRKENRVNIVNNIQNNSSTTYNTNNTLNLQMKDFGFENISHIENDKDYMTKCFLEKDIAGLIKSIHCDEEHPENHNVRIKSLKKEFMETFVDGRWIVTDQEETLDELLNKGYRVLNLFSYRNKQHLINECEDGQDEYNELRDWLENLYHDNKIRKPLKRKLLILFVNNKTLILEKEDTPSGTIPSIPSQSNLINIKNLNRDIDHIPKVGAPAESNDDDASECSSVEELSAEEASKYTMYSFKKAMP
jgi:hypothetical protein